MGISINIFRSPSNSYSRELDMKVQMEERPYGYEISPPPADTGDYDMYARESHVEYPRKGKYG